MKRDLTDAFLRAQKTPARGRVELWDARVPGLVLRVMPSGRAAWSVRARTTDGKRTRPTLGTWPAVGIAEARRRALATLAAVQGGADPVQERRHERAARAASAAAPTVADRLTEWSRARGPGWSQKYRDEIARQVDRDIVPALGKRVLADTTRTDWTDFIAAKRRTAPAMASSLFRTVSSFLGHAEAHGWIDAPLLPRKGLRTIAPPASRRERVLNDAELLDVWRAAEGLSAKPRAFFRLLMLTGCRVAEAGGIRGAEIDLPAARWTIPAARAKNGRAITVPLGELALRELSPLVPADDPDRPFLGRTRVAGLSGVSKIKREIDAAAPIADWRLHDLRRTVRTGLSRLGVPREVAEACINHVGARAGLVGVYDRHDYAAEVVAALLRWQAHVAALVDHHTGAEIVPIRAAR